MFNLNRDAGYPFVLMLFACLITATNVRVSYGQNDMADMAAIREKSNPRLQWFRAARFGMFIHWDMSSVLGTEISWSRKATKPLDITGDGPGYVEDSVYDNAWKRFNPTRFNAVQWVKLAKKSGMKYLVFTAKHHGGFCMWNTRFSAYNIMRTPFGRDVLKELADACHSEGLGFGIYYSPRDWHHPDYGGRDNQKYLDYMNGQLTELLTNYGKVDILWFDSYGKGKGIDDAFWHIGETYKLIRKLQPDVLINNRLQTIGDEHPEVKGDWDTPEQDVGKFQNDRLWESCLSLVKTPDGGGWSYRPDGQVRSFQECIGALSGCATGDGNLLLDAGPDATGVIPTDQSERLLQMGDWINRYGKSIYATHGGPFTNGPWGGATFSGKTIYLHIVKWDGDKVSLPALRHKILRVGSLTNNPGDIKLQPTANTISISLDKSLQTAPENDCSTYARRRGGRRNAGGKTAGGFRHRRFTNALTEFEKVSKKSW